MSIPHSQVTFSTVSKISNNDIIQDAANAGQVPDSEHVCVCVCVCVRARARMRVCLSYPCEDKSHFVKGKSEVQRGKVTCPILI